MTDLAWDTLICNALVFDGSGEAPRQEDIALKDGQVAARGRALPQSQAGRVIEGEGKWLMPGLLDIHTHLDLEVDLEPGLPEVVRHGTTTVVVGNCSLGTCFGQQVEGEQNPIVDCFTRVENIPKSVLQKCVDAVSWADTGAYMDHFADIPLGPNVGVFLPHSMLRVEVMGLQESISREPTEAELAQMESLLSQAMDQGYLGMSTDGLPFHYLANQPHTDKRIPTQFAGFGELKRLLKVVRDRDRVWQTTPILEHRAKAILYFLLTSGRLFGKTLKTSALSAVRFALAPKASNAFLGIAALANSRLLKGNIHFQALGTNFRIWSDGIVSPLFEELESTSRLIAKEYDDVEGRRALLDDPTAPATAVGLIGCGVMTGVGAAIYTAEVRPGASVAVFGCGGVGDSVIQGAKIAGATTIIAVDIDPKKLEWAKEFGATHTINAKEVEPVEKIKELTGGHGVTHSFEAVGLAETFEQALFCRDYAGTFVMIGVPGPGPKLDLDLQKFFDAGGRTIVSSYGSCIPARDFPTLANWYRQGLLDLDKIVSRKINLEETETAFEAMERGETLRSVIVFDT